MIIKKAKGVIQMLVLVMVMSSVLTSVAQMSDPLPMCVGFPCIDSMDCGDSCLCNTRVGMCQ